MADNSSIHPDYAGLVTFLVKPFLETPESLKVDCEISANRSRVWVRLAFDGTDKGRVFGRGGRNIQAIRSILEGVAKATGYSAVLDIFGSQSDRDAESERPSGGFRADPPARLTAPRSVPAPKPRPKLSE